MARRSRTQEIPVEVKVEPRRQVQERAQIGNTDKVTKPSKIYDVTPTMYKNDIPVSTASDAFYLEHLSDVNGTPENMDQNEYKLKKGFINTTINPYTGDPALLTDTYTSKEEKSMVAEDRSIFNLTDNYVAHLDEYLKYRNSWPTDVRKLCSLCRMMESNVAASFKNMAVNAFTNIYVHSNSVFRALLSKNLQDSCLQNGLAKEVKVVNGSGSINIGVYDNILEINIGDVFDVGLLITYKNGSSDAAARNNNGSFIASGNPALGIKGVSPDIYSCYNVYNSMGVLTELSYYDAAVDYIDLYSNILPVLGMNFNIFSRSLSTAVKSSFVNKDAGIMASDYIMAAYNACQQPLIRALENTIYILWCESEKYSKVTNTLKNKMEDYYDDDFDF